MTVSPGISGRAGGAAPQANISGYNLKSTPQFTPGMMKIFEQLLGSLGGGGGLTGGVDYLSQIAGGEEGAFAEAEAPAYSAFNKFAGQLGSRYSQLGARDSSSFQQALSGGAGQLAENLGAGRMGMRNKAIESLLALSQNLMGQKPYDTFAEKPRGALDVGGDIADILGKLLPLFMGG